MDQCSPVGRRLLAAGTGPNLYNSKHGGNLFKHTTENYVHQKLLGNVWTPQTQDGQQYLTHNIAAVKMTESASIMTAQT
jgi:hypothetical protein